MTEGRLRGAWAEVRAPGLEDEVAVEEPLEIRVDGRPLAVTMRTPGHDEELALGVLIGEGLIDGVREAGPTADFAANTVEVTGPLLRQPDARNFFTSSSCGVCGKGALEEVAVQCGPLPAGPVIDRDLLAALPDRLRPSPRRPAPLAPADVRPPRRPARHRPLHAVGRAGVRARGRRPPQRDG